MKGLMNIPFSERYDEEDDIYYVSFNTGEPSYAVELDDILLFEFGLFTNMPTGFRILNFKQHKVGSVKIIIKKAHEAIKEAEKTFKESLRKREDQVKSALEEVLVAS